jgi:hypothetical protein
VKGHPPLDVRSESFAAAAGRLSVRGEDSVGEGMSFRAMAATNLPHDDGTAELLLGSVVGGRDGSVVEEGEQGVLMLVDVLGQLEVFAVGEVAGHQGAHRLAHFGNGLTVERPTKFVAPAPELNRVLKGFCRARGKATARPSASTTMSRQRRMMWPLHCARLKPCSDSLSSAGKPSETRRPAKFSPSTSSTTAALRR